METYSVTLKGYDDQHNEVKESYKIQYELSKTKDEILKLIKSTYKEQCKLQEISDIQIHPISNDEFIEQLHQDVKESIAQQDD